MSATMETMMNALSKAILGAAAALALTAGAASAAVVCNEEGDCWRVSGEPRYEPGLKLRSPSESTRDTNRANATG